MNATSASLWNDFHVLPLCRPALSSRDVLVKSAFWEMMGTISKVSRSVARYLPYGSMKRWKVMEKLSRSMTHACADLRMSVRARLLTLIQSLIHRELQMERVSVLH